jgi:hypothetical protein
MNFLRCARAPVTCSLILASLFGVEFLIGERSFAADSSAPSADGAKSATRTWKDSTGKFTIEAKFLAVQDGKVSLLRTDGKRIELPLSRLRDDDQKYVQAQDAENPFGDSAVVKKKPATAKDSDSTQAEPAKSASGSAQLLTPDYSHAKVIRPASFPTWSFKPTSKLLSVDPKFPSISIDLATLEDSNPFFEEPRLFVARDGSRALVVRQRGNPRKDKRQFVEVVNLATGQRGELAPLPEQSTLLDACPDEKLALLSMPNAASMNETLVVAKLSGNQLVPSMMWAPFRAPQNSSDLNGTPRPQQAQARMVEEAMRSSAAASGRIEQAWFLAPDQAMTRTTWGEELVVWDLKKARALWSIPLKHALFSDFTLSPDRRLLAIQMADQGAIAVIDLEAGQHVATLPITGRLHALAFSDSNQRLAGSAIGGDAIIWDLNTGKQVSTLRHFRISAMQTLGWAGDFLLSDGAYLFDVPRRILLWEYRLDVLHPFSLAESHGGRLWALRAYERGKPTRFVSAVVPHEEAINLDNGLPSAEQLVVIRAGDSVVLNVDVDADIAQPNEVRSAIEVNLKAAGVNVVARADKVISVVCKHKEQEKIRIRMPFDPANTSAPSIVERTITPCVTSLTITLRGETIWQEGGLHQPGMMIFLNKDESVDQALDRLTRPGIDSLKNRKFDGPFVRPGKATPEGAYGTSVLLGEQHGGAAF